MFCAAHQRREKCESEMFHALQGRVYDLGAGVRARL